MDPIFKLCSSRRAWCALLAIGAIPSLGCYTAYAPPQAAVWSDEKAVVFPNQTPHRLEVHLRQGHVLVQHSSELGCDVEVHVQADDEATARAQAESIKPKLNETESGCQLRVSHPAGATFDDIDIRYHLRVPPDVELHVLTRSAEVAVRGFRGSIEVRTDTGEIHARPDGGQCDLVTESGPIRLEGIFDKAKIATESGGMEVILPARHSPVEFSAQSDSGPLLLDMADGCRMQLTYTTDNGSLRTDFPVEWGVEGEEQAGGRLFRGTVGDQNSTNIVQATVHSRTGRFEVRRLPEATAVPQR